MQTQESFNRNLIISYKTLIGDLIYKSYKKLIRRPSANTLSVVYKTTASKTLIGFFSTHRCTCCSTSHHLAWNADVLLAHVV